MGYGGSEGGRNGQIKRWALLLHWAHASISETSVAVTRPCRDVYCAYTHTVVISLLLSSHCGYTIERWRSESAFLPRIFFPPLSSLCCGFSWVSEKLDTAAIKTLCSGSLEFFIKAVWLAFEVVIKTASEPFCTTPASPARCKNGSVALFVNKCSFP